MIDNIILIGLPGCGKTGPPPSMPSSRRHFPPESRQAALLFAGASLQPE